MRPQEEKEDFKRAWDSKEHQVFEQFMEVAKLHRNTLECSLNKTGVFRSQHQLLVTIFFHPDASQKDLSVLLNVSAATIAVSVKKLEKGGYITRIVDQNDNRYNSVQLTEQGKEIVEYSVQFFRNIEALMFDGFTSGEMDQMEGFLNRMSRNLRILHSKNKLQEREGL